MNSANILLSSIFGFLAGVFVASFFYVPGIFVFLISIICPFLLIVLWRYKSVRYGVLFGLFLVLGVLRFNFVENKYLSQNESIFSSSGTFEAKILDINRRDKVQVLVVESTRISGAEKIRVTADNFKEYNVGEYVYIEGDIEEPQNFTEDFNWRGYLAKEGIGYVMYNPEINKTGKKEVGIYTITAKTKDLLRRGIEESLLPPHSALYKAMIIGDKTGLGDSEREALQRAGLSHIVAISGMHISIIVLVLVSFFVGAGLWRHQALYAAIGVLLFYILIIGAPASAGRAGVMAAVAILAERIGRPNSGWRALLFAAAVMIAFNPLLLKYDIGFQLSYLAVLGIILFSGNIFEFLKNIYEKVVLRMFPGYVTKDRPAISYGYERAISGIGGMVSVTLAAQILTMPVILYHFGYVSPWSVFSNILVLPVLGYALGSGFIAALAGSGGGLFAVIAGAPAWMFSSYIWFAAGLFN